MSVREQKLHAKTVLLSKQLDKARANLQRKYDFFQKTSQEREQYREDLFSPITKELKNVGQALSSSQEKQNDLKSRMLLTKKIRKKLLKSRKKKAKPSPLFLKQEKEEEEEGEQDEEIRSDGDQVTDFFQNIENPEFFEKSISYSKADSPEQKDVDPLKISTIDLISPGPSKQIDSSTPNPRDLLSKQIKKTLSNVTPGEKNVSAQNLIAMKQELERPSAKIQAMEFVAKFPSFARPYAKYLISGDWPHSDNKLDNTYGPRIHGGSSGVLIGYSQFTYDHDRKKIILTDPRGNLTEFPSTKGLWDLIFLQRPASSDYTVDDLFHYKRLLQKSRAIYDKFEHLTKIRRYPSNYKYVNIIKDLFPPKNQPSSVTGQNLKFQYFKKRPTNGHIFRYHDSNQAVDRLKLLFAGIQSGNHALQREANVILSVLKKRKVIK